MSLIASEKNGAGFEPLPEGVHVAICCGLIDLGEQYNKSYDNYSSKVQIMWQIPDETYEVEGEEKPRTISQEYGNSLGKKAKLRAHLEAWRGKAFTEDELAGFDLTNIVGQGCQLQILHKTSSNGKTYANISAIMALPKGMKVMPPTESIIWNMADDNCWDSLPQLPEWIQNKIKESTEYKMHEKGESPFPDEAPEEAEETIPGLDA